MLRGEYVILRLPEIDDADIITSWQNDREVTRYLPQVSYPRSRGEQEDYIRQIGMDKNSKTFIIETEDEVPIGMGSLDDIDWINSTAEIKVVLYAKNCWGRGYGYDTVKTLTNYGMFEMNLQTIYVKIIEGNERGIKCFQKSGYEIEGVLRCRLYKEGRMRNLVSMSIYKEINQEG